jgi:hypothetical protein
MSTTEHTKFRRYSFIISIPYQGSLVDLILSIRSALQTLLRYEIAGVTTKIRRRYSDILTSFSVLCRTFNEPEGT